MTGAPLDVAKPATHDQQEEECPGTPGDSARNLRQQILGSFGSGVINKSVVWLVIDEGVVAVLIEPKERWAANAARTICRSAAPSVLCGLLLSRIGRKVF